MTQDKTALLPEGLEAAKAAFLEELWRDSDPVARSMSASTLDRCMRAAWNTRPAAEAGHQCGMCEVGSYEGQVELVPPAFLRRADGRGICVDVCLALEISQLWQAGIKTTGCCCGHGKLLAYIGVIPDHIDAMKALGYAVQHNPSRPGDEDSFVPKTVLRSLPPDDGEATP